MSSHVGTSYRDIWRGGSKCQPAPSANQGSVLDVSWIHFGSKGQILSFVLDCHCVFTFGHFLGGYLERLQCRDVCIVVTQVSIPKGNRDLEPRLKCLVMEEETIIEQKGIDSYSTRLASHFQTLTANTKTIETTPILQNLQLARWLRRMMPW